MYSFLLLLPTYYGIPQQLYLLTIPFLILRIRSVTLSKKNNISLLILSSIVIFGILNQFLGFVLVGAKPDIIPYFFLHILTFFLALSLTKKDLQIFLYFILIEATVVIVEFALMRNTVFASHPDYKQFYELRYLYFIRPMGLSSGSATVAFKLLVGYLLIDYLQIKNQKAVVLLKGFLLLALLLNFNRTTLITVGIYWFFQNRKKIYLERKLILIVIVIIILANIGVFNFFIDQFFRGKGVDFSYRDVIWRQGFDFIKENLLTGNFSSKFYTMLDVYGELEHMHNSFIQMLATNGIIIFLFYILLIVYNINKQNLIYILPFMILSMYQYAIFWGISFLDIVFFRFLIFQNRDTWRTDENIVSK